MKPGSRRTGLLAPIALFVGLGLSSDGVHAEDVTAAEFAFGVTLTPNRSEPLHSFTLPESVLRTLVDADLLDLCVFDKNGAQRPLALHVPHDTSAQVSELPLPHFPLQPPPQNGADGVEVQVERDPTGNITRAFSRSIAAHDARLSALIDSSKLGAPIVGLNLALSGPRDFILRVQVEASDDLTSFRELTTATLAHVEHGGHTLSRDLVELPEVSARYLRLTITPPQGLPAETPALTLDSLTARIERPGTAPARSFLQLSGQPVTNKDGQVFTYTLPGAFHIDRYGVRLPSSTKLAEVTLLSSASERAAYRVLDRALVKDDAARELPRTDDDFFELRVSDKGGGIREGTPGLRLGYVAPQLLFASDDAEPYLLAYGSAKARCRRFDEDELVSIEKPGAELDSYSDSVRSGPVQTLAGKPVLTSVAPRPIRLYALWAVLIVAVGVLGLVARKLLRSVP